MDISYLIRTDLPHVIHAVASAGGQLQEGYGLDRHPWLERCLNLARQQVERSSGELARGTAMVQCTLAGTEDQEAAAKLAAMLAPLQKRLEQHKQEQAAAQQAADAAVAAGGTAKPQALGMTSGEVGQLLDTVGDGFLRMLPGGNFHNEPPKGPPGFARAAQYPIDQLIPACRTVAGTGGDPLRVGGWHRGMMGGMSGMLYHARDRSGQRRRAGESGHLLGISVLLPPTALPAPPDSLSSGCGGGPGCGPGAADLCVAPAVVRLSLPPVESAAGAAEGEAFQCNTWGCASKLGLQGKARLPACRPG